MHLVDEGIEHALEERSKPWGVAREGALLAALRVLVTALQTDGWLLQELRQHPKSGEQCSVAYSALHCPSDSHVFILCDQKLTVDTNGSKELSCVLQKTAVSMQRLAMQ